MRNWRTQYMNNSYRKLVNTPPCGGCANRTPNEENPTAPNCHMTCSLYLEYKARADEIREKRGTINKINSPLDRPRKQNRHNKVWDAIRGKDTRNY